MDVPFGETCEVFLTSLSDPLKVFYEHINIISGDKYFYARYETIGILHVYDVLDIFVKNLI